MPDDITNDRTSFSYRASLPGNNPNMNAQAGKARQAFKHARTSPYVREQIEKRSEHGESDRREKFNRDRKAPIPTNTPKRGPVFSR